MKSSEIRQRYFDYLSKHNHTIIPSASLLPENDPTTLFTGSGMQPLLPYLLGQNHPKGNRLGNAQKCFRSEDIDEVGDNRHTTFFEMLGNWSLGDYFKEEQLSWFFSFLVDDIGLNPEKLFVTVFAGDEKNGIKKDSESADIWKKLFAKENISAEISFIGSERDGYKKGMGQARIFYYDAKKNWWSRVGVPENMPSGEPGGPDSEVFYDFGTEHGASFGKFCHPNCDCGRFMEIGNSVFMEYIKNIDGSFGKLKQRNVDFGGGLERIAAAKNDNPDIFLIDLFHGSIEKLEKLTGKAYSNHSVQKAFRIISDHLRGATFMIADGILPSNTNQGYIVRRLIRRAIRYGDQLGLLEGKLADLVITHVENYKEMYPTLSERQKDIEKSITAEEGRFRETLSKGMRECEKIFLKGKKVSGKDAFVLFTTYGIPYELTEELAKEKNLSVDKAAYDKEMEEHQRISRTAAKDKFKGGLADQSDRTTMLHTSTHLMLAGLRKFLGSSVHQAGSNITKERTRFDLTHNEKISRRVLDQVETYVNEAISKKCDVVVETIAKEEAQRRGVEGSFWEKYPDRVHVYVVKSSDGTVYSQELCGGPHVKNTGEITGTFRIIKEESSGAGVRRVKAVLE